MIAQGMNARHGLFVGIVSRRRKSVRPHQTNDAKKHTNSVYHKTHPRTATFFTEFTTPGPKNGRFYKCKTCVKGYIGFMPILRRLGLKLSCFSKGKAVDLFKHLPYDGTTRCWGVREMARRKSAYIFAPEKQRGGGLGCAMPALMLLVAAAAAALLFNYAANTRVSLEMETVPVMSLDKAFEGFTVLHLSDLHAAALGSDMELWQNLLFSKTFRAVVVTGDMVGCGGDDEPLLSLIHTLQQLNPNAPIYFVAGDDDPAPVISTPRGTPEVLADWVRAAQQEGAVYLDAPVGQQVGKRTVWFVPQYLYDVDAEGMLGSLQNQKADMEALGQQYEAEGGAVYRALCYRMDAMERTVAAQKAMLNTDLQIAVTHAPLVKDYIRSSLEWGETSQTFGFRNVSLLLAGHLCAGQWRLPGVGAIYVPDEGWFPPDEGVVGMQRVNSLNQYISAGLGASEKLPMRGRLFNPPRVTLLKFTARIQ